MNNNLNEIEEIVTNKRYSIKDTGVSYRIINNWTEKGLISHLRNGEKSWHKLSLFDVVEIRIYEELRKSGLTIKKLLAVKSMLQEDYKISIKLGPNKLKLNNLIYRIVLSLGGSNEFLVCDRDAFNPSFLEEAFLAELISENSRLESDSFQNGYSLTILSIRRILAGLDIKIPLANNKLGKLISALLEQNGNRQEITVFQNGVDWIQKLKTLEYKNISEIGKISSLINAPNQKTTFHSNTEGAQEVRVEKEIK